MNREYPKIFRVDNYTTEMHKDFPIEERIIIQEKLDGSNITIEVKDGELNLYSRNRKIDFIKDTKNWNALIVFANEWFRKQKLDKTLHYKFHGEWLSMGKLPYNKDKKYKNTFWLFDIKIDKKFMPFDYMNENSFGFNIVPQIETKYKTFGEVIDNINSIVEDKKTNLDFDCSMEGIVIKTFSMKQRIKFVSKKYSEIKSYKKGTKKQSIIVSADIITKPRIDKYFSRLIEEGLLSQDDDIKENKHMGVIFKNLNLLSDDFLEEELNNIIQIVKKQIKKKVGSAVKSYIHDFKSVEKVV